ncbi:retinoid-inducible serine carboxypeptidase [Epinephelus moara]|uniref:retinoid-inducible serine carboxypeptidase n=1 Tax=Epinephelus moara TaxID=300413 RepID=UPI00214E263A|nr:retinoid-inducible serine carboxypeptidase [Epinephelus moara]
MRGAYTLLFLLAIIVNTGLSSPLTGKEAWNYVTVRDGDHMFWWLYYADSQTAEYKDLPLVMWLQGGPGGSGSGFGNFEEIGPLNRDLEPRDTSWVRGLHLRVLNKLCFCWISPLELKSVGTVKCNFAGVALGDSWISPVDSVMTWGPYLYTTSLLDDYGLTDVNSAAEAVKKAVEQQQFEKATELWAVAETVVEQNTNGVNFYNILTQEPDEKRRSAAGEDFISLQTRRHVRPLHSLSLSELMNGPIRKKLGIIPQNVTWGGQAEGVFSNMVGDFMRPVVDVVDQLLKAGVNVTIYNGQLDLIVDTMGQELWVKRLKWEGLPGFNKLRWTPLNNPSYPGITGAFYKTYKNFAFYWILKAGHMIPSDQGPMALQMMKMITQQD